MGRDGRQVVIYVSLDRHGGERQAEADRLYAEMLAEIRKVITQAKYQPISPDL